MAFSGKGKYLVTAFFAASAIVFAAAMPSHAATLTVTAEKNSNLGIIKGVVRDQSGSPIADATVAIFRLGTSKLLKQVSSANDGKFLARIIPGTYTVLAVAQGFNPVTLSDVSVNRSTELVYGFRLERSGSGNTLPEKRVDRNSSKWRIRAAQIQRAIYQNREGNIPVDETTANVTVDESLPVDDTPNSKDRRTQAVIETYFAGTRNGNYAGVNFAAMMPAGDQAEFVFSGQVGKGTNAPQRFGVDAKFRPNSEHQIRVSTSFANIGSINIAGEDKQLGQMSFQALDEWKIREGVILVYGLDYSRFIGAGSDSSISPRLGLQYDIDSKTRFQTAFTTQTDERSWSQAVNFEGAEVVFRDPVSVQDIFVSNNKPKLNRSHRLEFGIERILDNRSSVEANVFFDTAIGRGVGLTAMPIDALDEAEFSDITTQQQGNARGIRVVYNRRFSSVFSATAGYSFGNGQRLSANAVTNPSEAFDEAIFQSFFGQFSADLRTGTSVKTIYRLSPQATVFAIDPFKGRLAIYDPGLSVLVTQNIPTLGLPFRAEAIVDARNMFGFQTGVSGEEGSLRLNGQRRSLRGGILVRF